MNKIAMIIPYIGKFPNYFDTTLCTCSKNKSIDWYIFTDQSIEKYDEMYENIIFYKTTLESIKQKIEAVSGRQNIKCDTPYKLCDYKPLHYTEKFLAIMWLIMIIGVIAILIQFLVT